MPHIYYTLFCDLISGMYPHLIRLINMRIALIIVLTLLSTFAIAQNTLSIVVLDAQTQEPLPGASGVVTGTSQGASADSNGILRIENIPDGEHVI